jgi:plasmid maintenance system antidote protein VapI
MGVSRITVNQLVNDRQAITPEMALRLAKVLGTSPHLWLKLQMKADLAAARRTLGRRLEAIKPLRPLSRAEEDLLESAR